jgi:PIN domain nuclease of toxin-antitoxin system
MSRYLLDTHIVYWWLRDDRRLGKRARQILARSECFVSAASLWEMLIKNARGKLPLPEGSLGDAIEAQGFPVLAITARHVDTTRRFERSLSDPFDRLLTAIALQEDLQLLTQDATMLELGARLKLPIVRASA